ncbi:MAG: hypothetical protein WDZ76_11365 [Pseudohongiellaceae bacterium]
MPVKLYQRLRRNISEDGLIMSSSVFLVNAMIRRIDFHRDLRILEIGSGRGVFTKKLAAKMSAGSQLDVCEIKQVYNPYIEAIIRNHSDKKITLSNDCITQLADSTEKYDVILSSLPLKNFASREDNNAFLYKVIRGFESNLKTGGIYLQYQYFRSNKADIENIFGKKMNDISFVFLNVLPAFVYSITK